MRLLQLATGPGELIDLHPNITVVTGLDEVARGHLTDTIVGLARGTVTGHAGLLEAHGVLFELSAEMLALLDIGSHDLRPVVTVGDFPTAGDDPRVRERLVAERALADLEARWLAAREEHGRAQSAGALRSGAVDWARRALEDAESDAEGRIRSVDSVTSHVDHAIERRRERTEQVAVLAQRAEQTAVARAEVEEATAGVRSRQLEAAARCSELATRLDEAQMTRHPDAEAEAEQAAAALARAEAEVEREAEREAVIDAGDSADEEPPLERSVRLQQSIEVLDKRLAAFAPAEVHHVANSLAHVRSLQDGELVPVPEAIALAEELAALEVGLVATSSVGATPTGLAEGRARLDDARQALLEAEQAVRDPELDRGMVDRLEQAHADLLDATDRADGRFGGARAQRRVDALRSAEHAVLDEMGFASYSDYMMGYSLLHVDPAKEAALDAARAGLASAEDAWRALEAETEAELARAEQLEQRRVLIEQARTLLGRSVPTGTVVDELRGLRVEAVASTAATEALRQALGDAGVVLGDEDLDPEDLVLVAEAWLDEAGVADTREQEIRTELVLLDDERAAAIAAVEAEAAQALVPDGPSAEDLRAERLSAAQEELLAAEARRRAHLAAEVAVSALTEELAAAVDAERIAAGAAADAEGAVATAAGREEAVRAELRQVEQELAEAMQAEADGNEPLRAHADGEEAAASSEDLAEALAEAETAVASSQQVAARAEGVVAELNAQRLQAIVAVESLQEWYGMDDGTSMAEEIEWYLLARLAAQRSVSLAGSLPLLLDDALVGLDERELRHVLGRLERMADAVQVIVVTDDVLVSSWALVAGPSRAAVVRPQPISTA